MILTEITDVKLRQQILSDGFFRQYFLWLISIFLDKKVYFL